MFDITMKGDKAYVRTPYNKMFVTKIKNIGGAKWDASSKSWIIPANAVEHARQFMFDVYGRTDLEIGESLKITIRITKDTYSDDEPTLYCFGKAIVSAMVNSQTVDVKKDTVFVEGEPEVTGFKQLYVALRENSIIEIHDVKKAVFDKFESSDWFTVMSVVPERTTIETLKSEKVRLSKALENLEKQIEVLE